MILTPACARFSSGQNPIQQQLIFRTMSRFLTLGTAFHTYSGGLMHTQDFIKNSKCSVRVKWNQYLNVFYEQHYIDHLF